jgi:hypothetical protein
METIVIDLSTILYWFLIIYLPFNIIILVFDWADNNYSFNLKEKPFSILNPFRNIKAVKNYFRVYLFMFIISIFIGMLIYHLTIYLQSISIIFKL